MSENEKKSAIPVEGNVDNAKPEVKEGLFKRIGRKAKEFAAKPAVRKVAKIGLNALMAAGLVGLGWVAHDISDGTADEEDETVTLTGGELEEESSEEETEANE